LGGYTPIIKSSGAQQRISTSERGTKMMGGYSAMAGFGWLGISVMALFWIGVIVLVVWGLTRVFSTRQPRVELDAEEILKQRYARGEISREEFVQAREALR
jgi:putative membrane protein